MLEKCVEFLMLPAMMVFQGATLSRLWNWFVAPTFKVEELTIQVGTGLFVISGLLFTRIPTHEQTAEQKELARSKIEMQLEVISITTVCFLFGAVIHYWGTLLCY